MQPVKEVLGVVKPRRGVASQMQYCSPELPARSLPFHYVPEWQITAPRLAGRWIPVRTSTWDRKIQVTSFALVLYFDSITG